MYLGLYNVTQVTPLMNFLKVCDSYRCLLSKLNLLFIIKNISWSRVKKGRMRTDWEKLKIEVAF